MGKYKYSAVNTSFEVREPLNFHLLINSTITICFVLFIGHTFEALVGNTLRAPGASIEGTWRHGEKKKIGDN